MSSEFRVHDIPVEPLDDGAGEDALPPVGQRVLGEAGRPPVTLLPTPQVSVVQLAPALWHLHCRSGNSQDSVPYIKCCSVLEKLAENFSFHYISLGALTLLSKSFKAALVLCSPSRPELPTFPLAWLGLPLSGICPKTDLNQSIPDL